ncbi:MAG TPA: filamentous hemagglutinin N-terminal domain-containing protein, partial [Gammaproteobacteria bacterium]
MRAITHYLRLTGFCQGLCCVLACALGAVQAAPTGGTVTAGEGSINQSGGHTDVYQDTGRMAIDWQSFNLASDESVRFHQPDSSSAVLNRILDTNPSRILGQIDANGRVFLMNPYGIVFGPGSRVNVNALVASSLSIDTDDFMRGDYRFSAIDGQAGAVINQGLLQAATGGSISLLGGAVANEGLIIASLGEVNLAAGGSAALDFDGDGLLYFAIDDKLLHNTMDLSAAVDNSGEIRADGGYVLLQAKAARGVFDNMVNNDGLIQATGIEQKNGEIRLVASGGGISNSGELSVASTTGDAGSIILESDATTIISNNAVLDAGSAVGQGGNISVLGKQVGLFDQAHLNAGGNLGGGEILIGGDFQGANENVPNALRTYVGRDVNINADALHSGDGGRVIVWADETTRYYGSISARGGINDGDGGFAEVSGKNFLAFNGSVNLSGTTAGTLLLDPDNITIEDSGTKTDLVGAAGDDGDPHTYAFAEDPALSATIDADVLTAIMDDGTTVKLQAHNDILVNEAIDSSGSATAGGGLTLQAGRHIDINVLIATNGGDVHLEADSPHFLPGPPDGIGELRINAAGAINTNNGNITLIGADLLIDNGASIDAGNRDINIARSVNNTEIQLTATDTAGRLSLSEAELATLKTTGNLVIGQAITAGSDGAGADAETLTASQLSVIDANLTVGSA